MRTSGRSVRLLLAVSLAVLTTGAAAADTIYLKNGRVIRTSSAQIDGDHVIFLQFGHPVSIPMTEVERVVEDDEMGPAATPVTQPPAQPVNPLPPAGAGQSGADEATGPEDTREYWQGRVRSINAEKMQLERELQELRRIERAFLFSHRSTADTRGRIEDVEARLEENERALPELRREARRKGIPAGWLRLPSGG